MRSHSLSQEEVARTKSYEVAEEVSRMERGATQDAIEGGTATARERRKDVSWTKCVMTVTESGRPGDIPGEPLDSHEVLKAKQWISTMFDSRDAWRGLDQSLARLPPGRHMRVSDDEWT